jgi:hypothetical protein
VTVSALAFDFIVEYGDEIVPDITIFSRGLRGSDRRPQIPRKP